MKPPCKAFVLSAFICVNLWFSAPAATVNFQLERFTGATNNRPITISLASDPLAQTTNIVFGVPITLQPTNSRASINLLAANYWVSLDQVPVPMFMPVPDSTNIYNAVDLIRDGLKHLVIKTNYVIIDTNALSSYLKTNGDASALINVPFQTLLVTNLDGRVWSNSPTDGYWHSGATYQAVPDRMVMTSPFHIDVSNNSGLTNELIIRNAGLHWTSQIVADSGYVGDGSGLTNLTIPISIVTVYASNIVSGGSVPNSALTGRTFTNLTVKAFDVNNSFHIVDANGTSEVDAWFDPNTGANSGIVLDSLSGPFDVPIQLNSTGVIAKAFYGNGTHLTGIATSAQLADATNHAIPESMVTGLPADLSSKASTNDSRSLSFSGSNWLTGTLDLEYELRLTNSVGSSGDVVASSGAGKSAHWVTLGSAAFTASSAYDAAGAAQNATNGLGSAAFTSSSSYDAAGSASAVTNTSSGGSLFGRVTVNRAVALGTGSIGLDLTNSNIATTGGAVANQTFAEQVHFGAQGWKNNATAASQPVDLWLTFMGVQGNATASSLFVISNSINGGTLTDILHINQAGFMVVPSSFNAGGNLQAGNGFAIDWASSTTLRAPADGQFEVRNSGETLTNLLLSTKGVLTTPGGFITTMSNLVATSNQTNYTVPMIGDNQIFTANTNANLTITTPISGASSTVLFNCVTSTVDCIITLPANLLTNINLNLRVTNGWAKALNLYSIDGSSTNILVSDAAQYHR